MANITYTVITRIVFYSIIFGIFVSFTADISAMESSHRLSESTEETGEKESAAQESGHPTPDEQIRMAIARNDAQLTVTAIEHNANVNQEALIYGPPLLHAMSHNCSPEIINLLLARNANPNQRDADGRTILHNIVLMRTQYDYVESLLIANANINAIDGKGNTPLHSATSPALYRDINIFYKMNTIDVCKVGAIVSLLINAQANPLIPNNAGISALDQCRRYPLLSQIMLNAYAEVAEKEAQEEEEEEEEEENSINS